MVHELDPKIEKVDEEFRVAALLLASTFCGPDYVQLRMLTGYPHALIKRCLKNFTENGIWKDGKVCISWTDAEPGKEAESLVCFWLDVLVGVGSVVKVS